MPKLFGALFVALDALLFVDVLSSSFDIFFYLLSEPLGVVDPMMVLKAFWGSLGLLLGALGPPTHVF